MTILFCYMEIIYTSGMDLSFPSNGLPTALFKVFCWVSLLPSLFQQSCINAVSCLPDPHHCFCYSEAVVFWEVT